MKANITFLSLLFAMCLGACAPSQKSQLTEGSSWNMCGSTSNCDQTFPVTILRRNGETLTLKIPSGTLDVSELHLQIVSEQSRTLRVVAKPK